MGAIEKKTPVPEPEVDEPKYSDVPVRDINKLRRLIEQDEYEEIEETIQSNPRYLITVSDSATYMMAGPKYNACHIAARSNKPDIIALILKTISNPNYIRRLYPKDQDFTFRERLKHLIDSYLNTPDARLGCTPLHFACTYGYHRVVRVLLTFEECESNLRNSNGLTALECTCSQYRGDESMREQVDQKIRKMFKTQLHTPLRRYQLNRMLLLAKQRRLNEVSFFDESFIQALPSESDDTPPAGGDVDKEET